MALELEPRPDGASRADGPVTVAADQGVTDILPHRAGHEKWRVDRGQGVGAVPPGRVLAGDGAAGAAVRGGVTRQRMFS